jgi:hypothetical protein
MTKGRRKGKHAKRVAPVRPPLPVPDPAPLTGTHQVVLDNTVPGGTRLVHTPNDPAVAHAGD